MKSFSTFFFAVSSLYFFQNHLFAQTCPEIFLQGQYVEVGVSACGSYGTDSAPPAGFHPNSILPGLGYVVDHEKDGWATSSGGTAPNYCGDYFVPGSPVEGWALTANGIQYINSNGAGMCYDNDIPCASTYSLLGTDEDTAVWIGNTPELEITQMTMVPDTDLFFLTRICIKNTSADTVTGIYYSRNVDPDNEQPWTGNFVTLNTVISQPVAGVTNVALVEAVGLDYGCYFSFGTEDSTAMVGYGGFHALPADSIYHSSGGIPRETTVGVPNTADIAVSIAWNLGSLLPGDQVCISFAHVLDTADLDSALLRTGHWGPDSVITTGAAVPSTSQFALTQTSGEDLLVNLPMGMDYKGAVLELIDVNGSKVRSMHITSSSFSISTNGLAPGVYMARIFKGERFLGQTKTVVR